MVGRPQRIVVLEVNLVLAGGNFVMRSLHLHPHRFQRNHHVASNLRREVRGEVEIAALIVGHREHVARVVHLQQEELQLRPGIEDKAHLGRRSHRPAQDVPRIAGERIAFGRVHVANQASGLLI